MLKRRETEVRSAKSDGTCRIPTGLRTFLFGRRITSYNVCYTKLLRYGTSSDQIFMHNGQVLHNEGFRGQGMLIAVTDAGFSGLPYLPAFDSLYQAGRVVSTRNFVYGGDFVYSYSTHGMRVLSILSGNYPGSLRNNFV